MPAEIQREMFILKLMDFTSILYNIATLRQKNIFVEM